MRRDWAVSRQARAPSGLTRTLSPSRPSLGLEPVRPYGLPAAIISVTRPMTPRRYRSIIAHAWATATFPHDATTLHDVQFAVSSPVLRPDSPNAVPSSITQSGSLRSDSAGVHTTLYLRPPTAPAPGDIAIAPRRSHRWGPGPGSRARTTISS